MNKNTAFKRHTGHYFPHDFTKRQKETDLGCDQYRIDHTDLTENHSHAGRVVESAPQ